MKKYIRNMSKVLCASIALAFLISGNVGAYKYTGFKMSNPSNIKIKISTTVGAYTSDSITYAIQWENKCNEIGFSIVDSGENIYFYGDYEVNNGLYAASTCRNDSAVITYHKRFLELDASQKRETIVHEVGHTLGLDHCQLLKNSTSVMRANGFNGKAYPLSDDIAGISALY